MKQWDVLDLAYNKLSGTLISEFSNASKRVSLAINRLGGSIPMRLANMKGVSLLEGNVFLCRSDRSDLPQYDEFRKQYKCGSNAYETSSYIYIFAWFTVLVTLFVVLRSPYDEG